MSVFSLVIPHLEKPDLISNFRELFKLLRFNVIIKGLN
jgi:hypothetical protein